MAVYPPVGFHFQVRFEISNEAIDARFQEVSGISSDLETEDVTEGGENRFKYKLPVRISHPSLVLKRGMVTDSALIKWIRNALDNFDITPISIVVSLLNENHQPLISYAFINAYPLKWSVSAFNAESSNLVIETIEMYYQFYRVLD